MLATAITLGAITATRDMHEAVTPEARRNTQKLFLMANSKHIAFVANVEAFKLAEEGLSYL